jgi:cytochrome c-type biogenesis protein CcmH/NrfG
LRKNYALLLITGAIVVAAVVIFVGSAGHSSGSPSNQPAANDTSLPPGHPAIDQNGASTAPAPDYSKTIAALKAKLDKNPSDAQTVDALGTAYFMSEQYDKAQSLFSRALKLHPGDPGATVRLAMVFHAKGDDGKAKSLIQRVLKRQPDFQEAHYDLAIIYFSQQRAEQAKAEWKKAAAIDPASALGRQAQGFVDLMEGRTPAPTTGQ